MKGIGVLVLVVIAAGAAWAQGPQGTGGWWDDVFAERAVPLSAIMERAESYRDVPVTFVVQFRRVTKGPTFFTRFEPERWLNFAAWPDEAPLWEKKAFDEDCGHLFIRRDNADQRVVASAATYDRFAVSAIVRDVIRGRPWIEVTSARKLTEKVSEGSLMHLVKGLMLRDHRKYDAAAQEFEAADAETLPKPVRLLAMREHAFALLNCRKPKSAEERLAAALELAPGDADTTLALAHVKEAGKGMVERAPVAAQPPQAKEEDQEPVPIGPPDPLAPRKPRPKAAPESRPAGSTRMPSRSELVTPQK